MKEVETNDIRTLQLRLFKIFLEFEKVCLKHNLRFYLIAGTLLGAIRHKGFIPWDDDIDVAMPRRDYEKLLQNAGEWFSDPYELDCRERNNLYPWRFAKVHDISTTCYANRGPNYIGGVYIDIFPYDGLPDGKTRQKLHLWRHRMVDKLFYFSFRDPFKRGRKVSSYLLLILQKILSPDYIYNMQKRISTKYDFETSKYITDHDCGYRGILKKKALGNVPAKVIFEGHETYGIADWDYFLTTLYGDYMKLPPLEKRKSHHYIVYRDLNLPCKEYQMIEQNVLSISKSYKRRFIFTDFVRRLFGVILKTQ